MVSGEWLVRAIVEIRQQVEALSRGSQMGATSVQGTAVRVFDEDGNAIAELGAGVDYLDGPEPARPTPPAVTSSMGSLIVSWDGDFEEANVDEGAPATLDASIRDGRVEVHATTDPTETNFDADTRKGALPTAGGTTLIQGWEIEDVVYVRLIVRALTGKASEPSEATEITVEGVDLAALTDELDAARTRIENAREILVDGQETLGEKLTAADDALASLRESIGELDETTLPRLRQDLDAARDRLTEAESDLRDAFGEIEAVGGRADAAADAAQGARAAADTAQAAAEQAARDATDKAAAAQAAAEAHAAAEAEAARLAAVAEASGDATDKAAAAQAAAEAAAARDAQEKADAAQDAAEAKAQQAQDAAAQAAQDAADAHSAADAAQQAAEAADTEARAARSEAQSAQSTADSARQDAAQAAEAAETKAQAALDAAQAHADAQAEAARLAAIAAASDDAADKAAAAQAAAEVAAAAEAARLADAAQQAAEAKAQAAQDSADGALARANEAHSRAGDAQGAADAAMTRAGEAAGQAGAARQAADAAAQAAADAAGIASGKSDVLVQPNFPATAMRKPSTLWIDTSGPNMLANGEFNDGFAGWVMSGSPDTGGSIVDDPDQPGNPVFHIGSDTRKASDLTPVHEGELWRLTFRLRSTVPVGTFSISRANGAGFQLVSPTLPSTGNEWRMHSMQVTIPAGVASIRARFAVATVGGVLMVDDVELVRVDSPTPSNTPRRWDGVRWAAVTDKTAKDAAAAAAEAARQAEAARDFADELPKVLHGTTVPSGTAPNGSVWFRHRTNLRGPVIGQWNRENGSWVETPIASEAIANLDVGKLTAGSAEIVELVSQKIAAAVGRFLELDVGQLTVTGTSKLADVVAESIAGDIARFLRLEVGQIVGGEAELDEALIRRLFTEVVVAGLITATDIIGENAIIDGQVTARKITASEELWAKLANFVELRAGHAQADFFEGRVFRGVSMLASRFVAGDSVEITEESGIRQYGADGALNVSLPSDGSPAEFRGDLRARRLVATDEMSVQGPAAIAAGGRMRLESGVVAPLEAPSITSAWDRLALPALTEGEIPTGLVFADGHWWRALELPRVEGDTAPGSERGRVEKITTAGVRVSSFPVVGFVPRNGMAFVGGELVLIGARAGDNSTRWVRAYTLTGSRVREWQDTRVGTLTYEPCIGTDGTNVVIAQCNAAGIMIWRVLNRTTGAFLSDRNTGDAFRANAGGILIGAFDFGGSRAVLAKRWNRNNQGQNQFPVFSPAGAYEPGLSWHSADMESPVDFAWDGSRFWSMDDSGNLATYQPYESGRFVGDNEDDWWAAVAWDDGADAGQATPAGPAVRFKYLRRSILRRSNPAVPRGVVRARMYFSKGSSPPVREGLRWVVTSATPSATTRILSIRSTWSNGQHPPASSSFTESAPGILHDDLGNFEVDGTGAGKWGPLRFARDGSMTGIEKTASGFVNVTPSAANTPTRIVVTLPAGRFTTPPRIVASANTTVPGTTVTGVAAANVSATNFEIAVTRSNTTTTGVFWIAVGE